MKELSESDSYLATDDPNEKDILTPLFKGHIFSRDSIYKKNTKAGIQDDLIEMFLLAGTKKYMERQ